MEVSYLGWEYNPVKDYYFKTCYYRPNSNFPWRWFYIIYFYSHPTRFVYFYCFNPFGPENGCYWCRCWNPLSPDYNPGLFSTLHPFNQHHDIDICDPLFPPFITTPAPFPGTVTPQMPGGVPLSPLPGDLP